MPTGQQPQMTMSREELAGIALIMALVIGLPLGFASSARTFGDGDVSWHIATGQWIFAHARIPTTDPFSLTIAGQPWVAMEWLADLIFASAFRLGGYGGVAAVVGAALMTLHALLFLHLRRTVGPIGIAVTFVLMDVVLAAFMFARPHILIWPILAGWTIMLLRSVEAGRAPPLWCALIMVIWTNLHGSFPLGILIAGGFALDAMIKSHWKLLPQWSTFVAASILCALLNANGLPGLLQPFHIAGLEMLPRIQEWQPSTPAMTPQFYVALTCGLGLLLWFGVKVSLGRLLLLLGMLGLAFIQLRHQSWFVIVAAASLPPLFGGRGWDKHRVWPVMLMAIPFLALRLAIPLTPVESPANPSQLLSALPKDLRSKPVMNGYTFGGPMILAGIKPYIDGRAEIYGDAFFADYTKIIDGDFARFDRAVRRYGIQWTILPHSDGKLIRELDSSPDWQRFASTKAGVVHVRAVNLVHLQAPAKPHLSRN
jgi:hypothetical protein